MDNWLFTSSLSGWCASVLHEKVLLKNLISFATHLQGLVQCRVFAVLSPLPPLSTFPGLSALSTTLPSTERGSLWFWEGLANGISFRWTRLSYHLCFQVSICLQGIHRLIPFLIILLTPFFPPWTRFFFQWVAVLLHLASFDNSYPRSGSCISSIW